MTTDTNLEEFIKFNIELLLEPDPTYRNFLGIAVDQSNPPTEEQIRKVITERWNKENSE